MSIEIRKKKTIFVAEGATENCRNELHTGQNQWFLGTRISI